MEIVFGFGTVFLMDVARQMCGMVERFGFTMLEAGI
jgi:hypothetical protein